MARRKAKDKPEEKGFEQAEPLDASYGAFSVSAYPYGAKKPAEPQETPVERAPVLLNGIPIEFIPPWPTKSEAKEGTERNEVDGREAESSTTPSAGQDATDPHTTPPANEPDAKPGDTLPSSTAAVAAESEPLTRGPVENRMMAKHRWDREGRLLAVEHWMDEKRAKLKDEGVPRYQAADMVWKMAMAEFPPPGTPIPKADPPPIPAEKPIPAAAMVDLAPPADAVPGLYVIPENWPPLPDNATLQAELGWVQSQRLAVVEERGNATVVRLERASSPAPSKAALGWLETSIRAYAKFVDVAAKTLAGAADEAESVRRERMRLDEIRALLDEMHRDAV